MPEITTITSESLQAEVRRLLPSQRGFGTDLEAQNVIVPIIDLTPTAEGSALREDLQTASGLGNIVAVSRFSAGSTTIANTPAFYKYEGTLSVLSSASTAANQAILELSDGLSSAVALHYLGNSSDTDPEEPQTVTVSGITFLRTGDTFQIRTVGADAFASVTAWPVADFNGNFINPAGFSFE